VLFGLFNVRLGYWWNSGIAAGDRPGRYPPSLWRRLKAVPGYLFQTQGTILNEWRAYFAGPSQKLWYLTDGGHSENTGLYELIRRRLPFMLAVFLIALGSDYNILVMTRIREEAHRLPLAAAVRHAVGITGSTITTAGVILGGTFAILGVTLRSGSGGPAIEQVLFGIGVGVLLDTFVVRTLLVPAAVVLLSRWNWWPSRLGRSPHLQPRAGAAFEMAGQAAEEASGAR